MDRIARLSADPARIKPSHFAAFRQYFGIRPCVASRIGEEAFEDAHAIGVNRDAVMERHHRHPAVGGPFLVELIELVLECLLVGVRVV
jgi:hypothetical protein